MKILIQEALVQSKQGIHPRSGELEGYLKRTVTVVDAVSAVGTTLDQVITWTIFGVIGFNSIVGGSSPLLWGWLSSI